MNRMHTFCWIVASIIIALGTAPAYPSDNSTAIISLAIDPQTPTTIYAGTSDRGVFKSTDGGANWTDTGLTNTAVGFLAVAPTTPTTVYAGTYREGWLKSTDGGMTWDPAGLDTALDVTGQNPAMPPLLIDPVTPSTVYAVSPSGVFKSTDSGDSWTATALMNDRLSYIIPYDFPAVAAIQTLAIVPRSDPLTPATLYAGVAYVMSDAFETYVWGEMVKSTDDDSGNVWWVGPTAQTDYYSTIYWGAPGLAVAPATRTTPATVYTTSGSGFSYEYSTSSWGFDVCWTRDEDEGYPLGCSELTDTSATVSLLVIDPQSPATIYAAATSGVHKSTDEGVSWSPVNSGLTDTLQAYGVGTSVGAIVIDPVTSATLYAGTDLGVFKSTDGGANWSLIGQFPRNPLSSVSLSPTQVTGGTASTGTVTLITPAPAEGAVVMLSSSNSGVASVPASVTVAAGTTSVDFIASTSPVTASTQATISATLDGTTKSAVLTVYAPTTFGYISVDSPVTGGKSATGTVHLFGAPAPAGGVTVTLTSSNPAIAAVPASATVPDGASYARFTILTSSVATPTSITISGTYGATKSAVCTVTPPSLSSLTLNPKSVVGGTTSTGTVTINAAAPAGGMTVELFSYNTYVARVPASVTVAAGATSATFTVSTSPMSQSTRVEIRATAKYVKYVRLTVTPPTFSFLGLDPSSVTGGAPSLGPVTDIFTIRQADNSAKRRKLWVAPNIATYAATLLVPVTSSKGSIGLL